MVALARGFVVCLPLGGVVLSWICLQHLLEQVFMESCHEVGSSELKQEVEQRERNLQSKYWEKLSMVMTLRSLQHMGLFT